MNAPDWRHRAQAADDLLADIAAVCRGEMPAEPREGGSEAHRAAWDAVCALVAEVTNLRAEVAHEKGARIAAYASGALDGQDSERAAVVAWLFRQHYDDTATRIERGEHRREETG